MSLLGSRGVEIFRHRVVFLVAERKQQRVREREARREIGCKWYGGIKGGESKRRVGEGEEKQKGRRKRRRDSARHRNGRRLMIQGQNFAMLKY